ncbi:MAG: alpha-glucosidase [Treponema sp.]|jgi:oligo-1,6-glucosidase|nr:alpha-glucosidase [Treponema sp.]
MVLSKDDAQWWKRAPVYQIYPRSFCDSNGDGIGDINGIASKLGYLKKLGAQVLWISPIYQSPMRDNGYDISDYRAINPEFGTMADFDRLLEQAHGIGLKIVMDLVVNHSSNEHPWFIESRSSLQSPKRDYYIWRDGRGCGPPNNWQAWFGGSAWTYDEASGQYYLNLFSPHQPDLNWENPVLRGEIYDMMRWWLDKGIDGFRMDTISLISKPLDFPDGTARLSANGPRVHEFLQEMRREVLCKYDIMTVGEASCVTLEEAARYANADGTELNMVFQFEHVELDGDEIRSKWNDEKIRLEELKAVLARWQKGLFGRAWNSLYWCNHDQPRIVSRLGDDGAYREKSAKMLAICLHFMQGTPYIYQGEELGMTNAPFADIGDYRDLESINAYEKSHDKAQMLRYLGLKSRDNSRTPMHWNSGHNAGFSSASPWIMLNPNYKEINAEEQMPRSDSVFSCYQALIQLRKEHDIITFGDFDLLLGDDPALFAYMRRHGEEELFVICNFSREEKTFSLPGQFCCLEPLIANDESASLSNGVLGPFGAAAYYKKP